MKYYDPKTYLDILGAINIGNLDIDLKILNNAPPIFGYRVIRDGILLFCRNEKIHEDFIFHTLIDALEYIEDYRKMVLIRCTS